MKKRKQRIKPADESFEQTFIALMLLLLCFMVIMVSLAQLEGPRFRRAIGSVRGALSMLPEAGGSGAVQTGGAGLLRHRGGVGASEEKTWWEHVEELETSLSERLTEDLEGMVQVEATDSGFHLTLGSLVLFDRGRAGLRLEAEPILDEVSRFLWDWGGEIHVIGHTCDLPVRTARFPSNWDLSVARAVAVARRLEAGGVGGERLVVIGMGDSRPVRPNDREDHRALNRRVEIVLESEEISRWAGQPDDVDARPTQAGSPGVPDEVAAGTHAAPPEG